MEGGAAFAREERARTRVTRFSRSGAAQVRAGIEDRRAGIVAVVEWRFGTFVWSDDAGDRVGSFLHGAGVVSVVFANRVVRGVLVVVLLLVHAASAMCESLALLFRRDRDRRDDPHGHRRAGRQ